MTLGGKEDARRRFLLVPVAAVGLFGQSDARGPGTGAQGGTPVPTRHPVVGAWAFDTNVDDPANAPSYAAFHGDGTYLEAHPTVGVGIGIWQPTGERTADLTIVCRDLEPTAAVAPGTLTIRAAVEVDATGNALVAPYTFEGRAPDGAVLFAAALSATATRIEVVPMAAGTTPTS